jgi:hypothetical protein
MKYLLLLLCSVSLQAEFKNWTKTEQNLFNNFIVLNLMDVDMTYRSLKDFPNAVEVNPILGPEPSLDRLLLHKAVATGTLYYLLDKDDITRERDIKILNGLYMGVILHNGYVGFNLRKNF